MILRIKQLFDQVSGRYLDENCPVMFFRLGYADPQKNRTGQRPASEVLGTKSKGQK